MVLAGFDLDGFLGFRPLFLMPAAPRCLSGLVPDSLYTVILWVYKGLTGLAVCNCIMRPDPPTAPSLLTPHASHVPVTGPLTALYITTAAQVTGWLPYKGWNSHPPPSPQVPLFRHGLYSPRRHSPLHREGRPGRTHTNTTIRLNIVFEIRIF